MISVSKTLTFIALALAIANAIPVAMDEPSTEADLQVDSKWGFVKKIFHPPQDCEMSDFHCLPCSVTCDYGVQSCHREIRRHSAHGGRGCGALQETRQCINHHCPTPEPSSSPTMTPTETPTTLAPTTDEPSFAPSPTPSEKPTAIPTGSPSLTPTFEPTGLPTMSEEDLNSMTADGSAAATSYENAAEIFSSIEAFDNRLQPFGGLTLEYSAEARDQCHAALRPCGTAPEYVTYTFQQLPVKACENAKNVCAEIEATYKALFEKAEAEYNSRM